MATVERDFSNYYLGDNVYELAGGLLSEIAQRTAVNLGSEPNEPALQELMGVVGRNKVLRDNEEVTPLISRSDQADLVERSGVQLALDRSLWTPDITTHDLELSNIVLMGGVANWQDRGAVIADRLLMLSPDARVYAASGNRVMDTATEQANESVQYFFEQEGRFPTESEYAAQVIVPKLVEKGANVQALSYDTGDGDEIMTRMLEENQELFERGIAVARVANAGIIMATQLRTVARTMNPEFDADPPHPHLFVRTDTLPLARTDAEVADARRFQNPATALRQVVLTALKLHQTAQQN